MGYLKINQELVTEETARKLVELCPFSSIHYEQGDLVIDAGCRLCKLCVKKGPQGVIEYIEENQKTIDKSEWNGIAVYVEHSRSAIHPVSFELIGKALELAQKINAPVYALLIGHNVEKSADKILQYGVDKVYVYDKPDLKFFRIDIYANIFEDFISKIKPSSIFVGATKEGRMLAPRVAARFRTGLTADCTMLQIKENTDLVQIRPAFGGNIMAQIVTPNARPQFCTVRYKIFSAPKPSKENTGEVEVLEPDQNKLNSIIRILNIEEKPREVDLSEAETVVAAGRGIKTKDDLAMVQELADLLGAQMACTRPLVECGWFDTKRQIGLSGRTVNAKLIITVGVSGSVQFAAGMQNSECIIAIDKDKNSSIFDIAHYGFVGDLYEIVPALIKKIKRGVSDGL